MPSLSEIKSPLHGISRSVTVLSSSSNKDGQASCWDAGVGMVADRLTNHANLSTSTLGAHDSSHSAIVLVSQSSESKMKLRSWASTSQSKLHMYDNVSLSSSSSSPPSSESEDDPNFQLSAESTDVEENSVVCNEVMSLPSTASVISAADSDDVDEKSLPDPGLESSPSAHTSEQTDKSRDTASQTVQPSISPVPTLLSRIRPCHIVLNKIDPLLQSIRHRPPLLMPKREEQTMVTRGRGMVVACKDERGDKQCTFHEAPASFKDEEICTPPSCDSVCDREHSSNPPLPQEYTEVVNDSFNGHGFFQATSTCSPGHVKNCKGVNDSLCLSDSERQGHAVQSTFDGKVETLCVQENSTKVWSSRRKSSCPRHINTNQELQLGREEWLSPYRCESEEEVIKDSESPSLLARNDLNTQAMEYPMEDAQV